MQAESRESSGYEQPTASAPAPTEDRSQRVRVRLFMELALHLLDNFAHLRATALRTEFISLRLHPGLGWARRSCHLEVSPKHPLHERPRSKASLSECEAEPSAPPMDQCKEVDAPTSEVTEAFRISLGLIGLVPLGSCRCGKIVNLELSSLWTEKLKPSRN